MKNLWAPWRMEYILSAKPTECIFCAKPKEDKDRDNLILFRGKDAFIIMNKYPYNNGHLMVVPYLHTSSFDGLTLSELHALMEMTKFTVDCLKKAFRPEGFNIGINIGVVAGAGIEEHLHIHVVPRWGGDSNFMAVTAEIRVIPEHILETYDKLWGVFNI
ncbi:MAG: HIT domain-containing protein [Thermodesulfovibrionales bacterium]|nr:HIT domain-containing protein [Thermodesulfovibrionales bacterium]